MACPARHTKPKIPDDEFICPKCGLGPIGGGLLILEDAEDADSDCPDLHNDAFVNCENCGYGATGKAYAKWYAKQRNLIACPTCSGTGFIRKEEHGGS